MTHTDSHYWGVWWGLQPIETYLKKVPRFMSEFGLQAMPSPAVIRQFQPESADTLFSPQIKSHQKHPTGFENITAYLKNENLYPKSLICYIYLSQLVQAKGIGMAIQAQRASKPYCMGTLYWQLNDCWPVTSWSGIDSGHNWKALQYIVKNLYKDVMISLLIEEGKLNVKVVSDKTKSIKGRLTIYQHNFDCSGTELLDKEIIILPESSVQIYSTDIENLKINYNPNTTIIEAKFITDKNETYQNNTFLVPYGSLEIEPSTVEQRVAFKKDGYEIEIKADKFTPFVYLYTKYGTSNFSDNFFHLLPGEKKTIRCNSNLTPAGFSENFKTYTLNNYFEESKKSYIKHLIK